MDTLSRDSRSQELAFIVKFNFQVFDLVTYSETKCILGRVYWTWARLAGARGYSGAAWWFRVASLVDFLHLPAIGQYAGTQGVRAIPEGDRRTCLQGGAP